ncbi:MAG TPA: glycosyltransferase [Terriglobales bacterium]|nr:glycosyltransferase [Terriglobales bacterium]
MAGEGTAPRRRLLLVEFFSRGGLLHYSWQLAQGLAAAAPQTEVVLLTGRRPECAGAPAGVRLLPRLWTWNPHFRPRGLPRRLVRAWRGGRYLLAWAQVLRTARREAPDVILLGDLEHRCDAWFVRRLRRSRAGWHLADIWHNVEAFDRTRSGRLLRRPAWRPRLARQFDTVFVHGPTLAAQFEGLTGVRPQVIAHGNQNWLVEQAGPDPELDRRLQLPPGRPVALLFGTLSAYKGVEVLLRALAAIPERRRPLALIAGLPTAGVRLEAWQAEARRLGIASWVRWEARYIPTPEIAWYFRRADLVVLPYVAASQSGVAHLALTLGKPLIVTTAGGLKELIAGNGLVVEAGAVGPLAAALARLAGDAELRRRQGRRSAALAATRHDWRTVARSLLAAWPGSEPAAPFDPGAATVQDGRPRSFKT